MEKFTATEIAHTSECDYKFVVGRMDNRPQLASAEDANMERARELGIEFEQEVFEAYKSGGALCQSLEVEAKKRKWVCGDEYAQDKDSISAEDLAKLLTSDVELIYQLPLATKEMRGIADFLIKVDGKWRIQDAKIARKSTGAAAIQVGTYWFIIQSLLESIDDFDLALLDNHGDILTGNGKRVPIPASQIAYVAPNNAEHLQKLSEMPDSDPLELWKSFKLSSCGSCEYCTYAIEQTRDTKLVAGIRSTQCEKLREQGIKTIDQLAALHGSEANKPEISNIDKLARQAFYQVKQMDAVAKRGEAEKDAPPPVFWEIFDPKPILNLPPATPDDIYFDFEGDPMHFRNDSREEWGLEYMWGEFKRDPNKHGIKVPGLAANASEQEVFDKENEMSATFGGTYEVMWAHNVKEETKAYKSFIKRLIDLHNDGKVFHVYHYHAYETAALKRIAERTGIYRNELNTLLNAGVFVDLLPVVKESLTISQPSYSIKKLEPAYMGKYPRKEELDNAADSITEYVEAVTKWRIDTAANVPTANEDFSEALKPLILYNEYDVVSTALLHQWLIDEVRKFLLQQKADGGANNDFDSETTVWGPMDEGASPQPKPDPKDTNTPEGTGAVLKDLKAEVDKHPDLAGRKTPNISEKLLDCQLSIEQLIRAGLPLSLRETFKKKGYSPTSAKDLQEKEITKALDPLRLSFILLEIYFSKLVKTDDGSWRDNGDLTETLQMMWGLTTYFEIERQADGLAYYQRMSTPLDQWQNDYNALVLIKPKETKLSNWKQMKPGKYTRTIQAEVDTRVPSSVLDDIDSSTRSRHSIDVYYKDRLPYDDRNYPPVVYQCAWSTVSSLKWVKADADTGTNKDSSIRSIEIIETLKLSPKGDKNDATIVEKLNDQFPIALYKRSFIDTNRIQAAIISFLNKAVEALSSNEGPESEQDQESNCAPKGLSDREKLEKQLTLTTPWTLIDRRQPKTPLLSEATPKAVFRALAKSDQGTVLGVQGPPGTGKTYLASRVIAGLAAKKKWKVGVLAQSHKTINNVLEGVRKVTIGDLRHAGIPFDGKYDWRDWEKEICPEQSGPEDSNSDSGTRAVLPAQRVLQKVKKQDQLSRNTVEEWKNDWRSALSDERFVNWTLTEGPSPWNLYNEHTPEEGKNSLSKVDAKAEITSKNNEKYGIVFGATAWGHCSIQDNTEDGTGNAPMLDLLVVDEAAQFPLPYLMAVASNCKRILLLGDPQQLPQVVTGKHATDIDLSALSWWAGENEIIPSRAGVFLDTTYRMPNGLTSKVSNLSYDGQLKSAPEPNRRKVEVDEQLSGETLLGKSLDQEDRTLHSGVFGFQVDHVGNSNVSIEEATKIGELVNEFIEHGKWNDGEPRQLTEADILIVAPYNAQVRLIEKELRKRGRNKVQVGTVDKFQGLEAPIVMVSMANSNPDATPRGLEFVLSKNRLNVAISRAQYASFVFYSPQLLNWAPQTIEHATLLGSFIRVVQY